MRVLVCGGRDFTDWGMLCCALDSLLRRPTVVIHGAARGADTLAGCWGELRRVPVWAFQADWEKHGHAAGPFRNAQMIAEGLPDLVVAFPGGRGTADMVRQARGAGVRVIEVGGG